MVFSPASILEGFNEIYAVYGPKKPIKHGKYAKVAKSTRVCPPTGGGSSGPEKGVITKGVFSLEESLKSLIL